LAFLLDFSILFNLSDRKASPLSNRNAASASSGKEEKPTISTPQASANGIEHGKVDADDIENLSMRKRQKVETVKVEKVTVIKTDTTFMKANSFSALRGSKNETDRHHQQRGTKQANPRTDWRNLRPPGR